MADIDIKQTEQLPDSTKTKYKDMGDGTHAETLYIGDGVIRLADTGGTDLVTDDVTGTLATIDLVHHEVHEGETFQSSYKSPDDGAIADNASLDMLLVTGASKYAHLTFSIAAGGDCEVLFYESTVTSNDGTALAENNMKRYSTETATVVATYTPTVSNVGTLLHNSLQPGGRGPQSPGGTSRAETEWILKTSTKYLIRATNRAGSAQPMSIVAQWYEESDA